MIEYHVECILDELGEDIKREGLKETPARVERAWRFMTSGYSQDPADVLKADFSSEGYSQLVGLGPVEFYSTCEHHMLPFFGHVWLGYIPGTSKRVVGVSKLARLVEVFARRLQIQERMTEQIAQAIEQHLQPSGVAVIVKAQHLCMTARGVQKQEPNMVTSVMRGDMLDDTAARAEFLNLMGLR